MGGSSGSHMTGKDVTGTGNDVTGTGSDWKGGSHVFWNGKPLTSRKMGSWAQGGAKPLRKAGSKSKVQSPIGASGVVPGLKKKQRKRHHVGKQNIIYSKGSVTGDRVGTWIQDEGEHKSSWGRPSFLSF